MFEKKEYLYSETMGVCKVTDIVNLPANGRMGASVPYYHLKPIADKTKAAYIPVAHHQVKLRPLMTREEAERVSCEELEKMDEKHRAEVTFVLNCTPEKR